VFECAKYESTDTLNWLFDSKSDMFYKVAMCCSFKQA